MNPAFWAVASAAVLSGFFALLAYALGSLRRVQLEQVFVSDSGQRHLKWIEAHLRELRMITSLLRTLFNLVLMVAMIHLIVDDARNLLPVVGAVAAAVGVITIFGVAIPHAWAAYGGEKVLAACFPVLVACRYALYPVAALMAAFDLPIRRLTGTADDGPEEHEEAAKQEILQAASEGRAEGTVDADEAEMIESVMEFGDTHAGQIMTPRTAVYALPDNTPWKQLIASVVDAGHTRIPIYQGNLDHVAGILYAKDLLRYAADPNPPALTDIMRQPHFVPETKPLDDLLQDFKARKIHLAVVLDEYGGTAGVVTIEDVLEEIVGEITDEYDHPEPELMQQVDETTVEADGRLHIDDLNDALQLTLPEDEDYDTVAGFVFSELGRIPHTGETLETHGARLTVLDADARKITRLKIQALPKPAHREEL